MKSSKAIAALLFTVLVWGITPVFIRSLSVALGPADFLVIRYVLVSAICGTGLYVTGMKPIAREDWPKLLIISLAGMLVYNLGSAFGFSLAPAGIGGLIFGTQPLLIALLAALLTTETLTLASVIGLPVAFVGTLMIFRNGLAHGAAGSQILGGMLIFASGAAWAVYVVLAKPLINKYGAYQVTTLTFLIATVPMLLLASPGTIATILAMSTVNWLEMLFMVIGATVISTVAWNFGAARLSRIAAGTFLYFVPVLAVIAGAIMLDEVVTPSIVLGGFLILIGVAIAEFADRWIVKLFGRAPTLSPSILQAGVALLFAAVIWGGVPATLHYLMNELRPDAILLIELFPAGLLAIMVLVLMGLRPIALADWPRIIAAAIVGNCAYQILFHLGIAKVPLVWVGLMSGLTPLIVLLLSIVFARQELTRELAVGTAVALGGVILVAVSDGAGELANVSVLGLGLMIASAVAWAIYLVLIRSLAIKYGVIEMTCLTLTLSALPMIAFVRTDVVAIATDLSIQQWSAFVFLIVLAGFVTTIFWCYGVTVLGSAKAAVFLCILPFVLTLFDVLVFERHITLYFLFGSLLIFAGVAFAQASLHLVIRRLPPQGPPPDPRAAVERLVSAAKTSRQND